MSWMKDIETIVRNVAGDVIALPMWHDLFSAAAPILGCGLIIGFIFLVASGR